MLTITDQEFLTLYSYIKKKYGINLEKKRTLVEGRLSGMLAERGLDSFAQYMDIVLKDTTGAEVTLLLNKLTTNHTYFMREMEHFNYLSETVLPFFEKHVKSKDIRIWSAACSTGQEPYNIAMVIDQYFGSQKSMWDTTILATDISMKALEKAAEARYTMDTMRDVPQQWLTKYFSAQKDGSYTVHDNIRKEVIFKPFNLMEPFVYKKPFDLIFCRNVMIYFDSNTKDTLIDKFYEATAPGGFLFIGHSEVINREKSKYNYIMPAIYQKKL